jgi:hypothetical protein
MLHILHILTLWEPWCARQADCAVAEHEPRGAAGRLRSDKASARGTGAGAEQCLYSPGALGAQHQPDRADAEHEPRGAAGRLGSVKATVRGREWARSGFQPSGSPGALGKLVCAVAEHESRGAAGRLGSDKAVVRDGSGHGADSLSSGSPGAQRKPTAPSQSASLAVRRADWDQSSLQSWAGSRRRADFNPQGALVRKASRPRCRRA